MTHRNSYAFSYLFLFIRSSWCCQNRCKKGPKEINYFILFHFSLVHSVSLEEQNKSLFSFYFIYFFCILLCQNLGAVWQADFKMTSFCIFAFLYFDKLRIEMYPSSFWCFFKRIVMLFAKVKPNQILCFSYLFFYFPFSLMFFLLLESWCS